MADPGFPVGGVDLVGGTWTTEAVTFRKFYVSKTKESGPWGEGGRAPGICQCRSPMVLQFHTRFLIAPVKSWKCGALFCEGVSRQNTSASAFSITDKIVLRILYLRRQKVSLSYTLLYHRKILSVENNGNPYKV